MGLTIESHVADKVRSAFNFTIERFPLSGPEGMRTPFYGLFRSDDGTAVGRGSVSDRYVPHKTDDVLALVEAAGTTFGGAADVQCYFRHGHYVAIQPTREYRESIFGTRDNVFPRLILDAPYGGAGSFTTTLGYWRDACSNLSIMRQAGAGTSVSIRHTGGLRLRMDELIGAFGQLESNWSNLVTVIREMESRRVRMVDFLNAIYGEPNELNGRSLTMHKNRTESIFRRLQSERVATGRGPIGDDFVVSGWEAFNAVQGYVQHDSTRWGHPSEMQRIVRALHDSKVARAERLALTMAV